MFLGGSRNAEIRSKEFFGFLVLNCTVYNKVLSQSFLGSGEDYTILYIYIA